MITVVSFSKQNLLNSVAYSNIECIFIPENDCSHSIISLINKINGDYVLFLSKHDTLIDIDYLNKYKTIDDIVVFDYIEKNTQGIEKKYYANTYFSTPLQIAQNVLIGKYDCNLSNKLFRVSLLKKIAKTHSLSTNRKSIFLKCLLNCKSVCYQNHAITLSCIHADSESENDSLEKLKDLQNILSEIGNFFSPNFKNFIEDYIFLAKINAVKEKKLNKIYFNKVLPVSLATLQRNAWDLKTKIKLTLVYFFNKIF